MKTSKRFNNAISKLVTAFFNDKLEKGICTACAVGNICNGASYWVSAFYTVLGHQTINPENYKELTKETIDKTGYSWEELAKVEKAFECNTKIHGNSYYKFTKKQIAEDQYKGLMAVVDVLCEIENIDPKEYKDMFSYSLDENVLVQV